MRRIAKRESEPVGAQAPQNRHGERAVTKQDSLREARVTVVAACLIGSSLSASAALDHSTRCPCGYAAGPALGVTALNGFPDHGRTHHLCILVRHGADCALWVRM